MSQSTTEHKTKKRKLAAAVDPAGAAPEPSTKRSKRDKDAPLTAKTTVKATPVARVDKGKARATDDTFRVVRATLTVPVPPVFAADLRGGVAELLDSMLMRYIPALQGVVLAHDRLEFLEKTATIKADCPFTICKVAFDATVWSPQVGMKLVGKINLSSPDHISLLVHRTFNVSIPRYHITTDIYEFEYGPAENDPEFGTAGADDAAPDPAADTAEAHEQIQSGGRWVHTLTDTKLGDADGSLEFTVVGLTIANQMISLVGSIQPDPFSPEHIPKATVTTATGPKSTRTAQRADPVMMSEREVDALIEDGDESDDEDAFQKLGRMGDEAEAAERRAREAAEETARKEKKRKRRESKAQEKGGDIQDASGERKSKKKKKTS
ncbi:hypothetical protein C2E23DRAFT_745246 [Lenzites betulinus]|nr:hypothetical protein C2E23DRAFT_745246 [Lenzites betulinus]